MPEEEKKDIAKLLKELELKLEAAKKKGFGNEIVVSLPNIMKDDMLKKLISLLPEKFRDAKVTIALNAIKKVRKRKIIPGEGDLFIDIEWTDVPHDI
ncbi:MAG: hypothetical protein Q6351_009905 [Candidatus Njordarchaeum guaymaensis]